MARTEQLSQYSSLLKIRYKARRRDAIISGSVFLVAVFATVAMGLLDELQGRSVYLLWGLILAFGLGFVQIWVRLEIVNASLELVDYLQRDLAADR